MISAILAVAFLFADPMPVAAGGPAPDASAQVAATPPAAAKPADTKMATAKDPKESRVCHYETMSGTRIPKKICQ
jgi:hypothetical protein